MLVLIWAAVFFSVRGSNAYSGSAFWGKQYCQSGFCITLNEREITAEAGLCVVIPCSFTTAYRFTPKHLVWFKCEPFKQRCGDSDIIFHTNKKTKKVQSEFEGRVSLLEPDVSQRNCSIMITDLKQSDSGSYQLRVNGLFYEAEDGFKYHPRAAVSVKGLNQKPTLMVPPLTEGEQTTLTCTAPGLCSGSTPAITWMWRGAGEKDSAITQNISAETSDLTAFTRSHSSSLTFNPSAEHHNTNVTCKINFAGDTTTEETVTLNVNYMREVKITGNRTVKEGDVLNLTCSVDSFPPSKISWSKLQAVTYPEGDTLTDKRNDTGTYLQEERGSFSISNVTAEDSGLYVCTAEYLNNTMTEGINITVIYTRKPQITGNTTVKEGDVLNLTCSVDSSPPSKISWTKFQTVTNPEGDTLNDKRNDTATYLQEERGSFSISNVTAEDSGLYVCTAEYLNNTMTEGINITVIYTRKPQITGNTTVKEGDVLNLTCSVDSFPPSKISWTKFQTVTYPEGNTLTDKRNDTTTYLQEERGYFSISNVTTEDSGLYVCTAEYLNNTMTEGINITVIYTRKPQITGNTTVKEGDVLNLTCSVDSFPPSKISWTKFQTVTYPEGNTLTAKRNDTATYLQEERGYFSISNVTAEDSGLYVCTAEHLNNTMTEEISVTVIWFSKILKGSGCVLKAEILTCVCISQGSPLPTIKWPLLKDYTEYSAITMVSYHTVNSSVTLNVKPRNNITVECISSNENGEAKENLITQQVLLEKEGHRSKNLLGTLSWLEIIIAFLVGVVLTAIICCLAMKCSRKKQRSHGNLDETLEMVTGQDDPAISDGQVVEDHHTRAQEGAENGAVVTEKAVPELNLGAEEVVYANVDFSLLKSKSPREAARERENTVTEYAEIKTQAKEEREDDDGEECGMLEDKEKEDEDTHHCVSEEEEGAEEAVYSTVNELKDELVRLSHCADA
ncbi:sialoadhesin-like [Odontesthes bonariensis]|uniref:sialoadhesin-like n=1 Tax=Odontesthes bonariensis TaxID=219752 RepID=UPI003F588A69